MGVGGRMNESEDQHEDGDNDEWKKRELNVSRVEKSQVKERKGRKAKNLLDHYHYHRLLPLFLK